MARTNKNKEAAIGSQNRTVGPNEAKSALTHCIKLQRPIMMWGAPGIGKSDIVKQIADAQKREVVDIRLPLWEPTDIKGIPYYNAKENNMVWASPAELPTDPKSNCNRFLRRVKLGGTGCTGGGLSTYTKQKSRTVSPTQRCFNCSGR